MDLSRRDALAALAATGVAGVAGAMALDDGSGSPEASTPSAAADDLAPLVAVAETVYPSAATGVDAFVRTYVDGLPSDRRDDVLATTADLDATALDWFDASLPDLDRSTRDRLLRDLGVDVADPDPDGNLSDRVRHHLVNELLYAFYASPTGGRLVGIENPIAYPGGTESYRRATMDAEGEDD